MSSSFLVGNDEQLHFGSYQVQTEHLDKCIFITELDPSVEKSVIEEFVVEKLDRIADSCYVEKVC